MGFSNLKTNFRILIPLVNIWALLTFFVLNNYQLKHFLGGKIYMINVSSIPLFFIILRFPEIWKNTQKCNNYKSDIRSRIFCLACRWKWMRIAAVYLVPIFILKDHKMQRPRLYNPAKNLVIFTDKSHLIANSVVGSLCMYYKYNINQGPRACYHT